MVIQPNMSAKAIVEVWEETKEVFEGFNIPIIDKQLQKIVSGDVLFSLLEVLNSKVKSSTTTCMDGG
jgi:hypothetical protein